MRFAGQLFGSFQICMAGKYMGNLNWPLKYGLRLDFENQNFFLAFIITSSVKSTISAASPSKTVMETKL